MNASLILRSIVTSSPTKTFFTICWVMVEPPRLLPLRKLSRAAEAMAGKETPWWS